MSRKSYLSKQVKLMTCTTTDLFTPEEFALYQQIMELLNQVDRLDLEAKRNKTTVDAEQRKNLLEEKKAVQAELDAMILRHAGTPRTIRVSGVVDTRMLEKDENDNPIMPAGVRWNTLRLSRKIAEFSSDMSRQLGLEHNDVTFDKIILKWKSTDILHQVVMDGFYLPLLNDDGTVEMRHFDLVTASAGQLRTDKTQCLSDRAWNQLKDHIQCGLDWDRINQRGGLNISKLFAYTALTSGATDPWPEMDIDHVIVIKDFSGDVTATFDFIHPNYTVERGEYTVEIKHTDGAGMIRADKSRINFMIRGPYIKGLVTPFDWLSFCALHGAKPVLADAWGKEHDLVAEDIWMILTTSQVKMWKFYDSWDEFKSYFKKTGWSFSRTNFEESYIPDSTMNYQFIESLVDFSDKDMLEFTQPTWDKIQSLASSEEAMLHTMRADETSSVPYNRALSLYAPLLRDGYAKETLKAIKKRWTMDAQSGKLLCKNKRLFVIPDMYAACEYWFLGDKHPKGLLENGEVSCKIYRSSDKVDCLRSPSLYMEHAVRRVSHNPVVYSWFNTNGIYTSCHDPISKILMFDCDGDQLNVVSDELLVNVAEQNIKNHDIVPLHYDANEVPPELINREALFNGLVRAHNSSNIGQVSNNLCKLWNSDDPDYESAKLLCYYNNQVIDGAKLPVINGYEKYPEVTAKITKAVGGRNSRMPHFFAFSLNGRHGVTGNPAKKKNCKKPNESIMNRICDRFSKVGHINMNYAGIAPFNWEMLTDSPMIDFNDEAVKDFCEMDNLNFSNLISANNVNDLGDKYNTIGYDEVGNWISKELSDKYGSLENVQPSVAKFLFTENNLDKQSHKQMFWRVFGDSTLNNLENNLISSRICPNCGMSIPFWSPEHTCEKNAKGFVTCIDCGKTVVRINSKQQRCPDCQKEYRRLGKLAANKRAYTRKKKE